MKKIITITLRFLLFIILTIISQIGGLVLLLTLFVNKKFIDNQDTNTGLKNHYNVKKIAVFIGFYLLFTIVIVPVIAPIFGREKVQHTYNVAPASFITVVLNRNYVRPELNKLLQETASDVSNANIEIRYLDANFPFINRFPLLPHLSHNDGKKIDLGFVYQTVDGDISNKQKSVSGYGVFEIPRSNESNQPKKCFQQGYIQYDYPQYLTLGKINKQLVFSETHTKILINSLVKNQKLGKLFIEPHLKNRMNVSHEKIRYHGCVSVRHDDHIHIQLH